MAEPPRIKRYSLVADSRDGSVRRFHLARRLERMEAVAELDRRAQNGNGARPLSGGEAAPGRP